MGLDPMLIVNVVEHVMARHSCVAEVKDRCLTCLSKISYRFATTGDPNPLLRLEGLVRKNTTSKKTQADDLGSAPATKPVAAVKQKGDGERLDLADTFGGDAPSSFQNGTTSLP